MEFFSVGTADNGSATGYATGILQSDQFCAFDKKGDFFVDGTAFSTQAGGEQIAYLARCFVNSPGQALVNSAFGKVTGGACGPLTFTSLAPYTLTSYPSTTDAVYQLAPAKGSTGLLSYSRLRI
ncbi:MAG: hypothetical protein WB615_07695 [Candidatus Tumulicola sp.]